MSFIGIVQSAFSLLGLSPELVDSISELGWQLPTPVQDDAIPLILGGADVMVAAETGTGKTGAFALPLLQIVHESLRSDLSIRNDPVPNNITMSRSDRDTQCAVSESGLLVQSRHPKEWAGVRSTFAPYTGKYAFECCITDEGLCRIGVSAKASLRSLGTDSQSYGYGGTGMKSHDGVFVSYGVPFGLNDIILCYIDYDIGYIGYMVNGQDLNRAFDISPSVVIFKYIQSHRVYY